MLKIGITGGIGSGKTIISKVFEQLGIAHYAADNRAKNIVDKNTSVQKEIQKFFGSTVFDQQGNLNRGKVREIIFNDKSKLEELNSIIHPAVEKDFQQWLLLHKEKKYILKEAAILFESGSFKNLDYIIAVVAPVDLRIERVIKRDALSREAVELIMKSQISDEEKIKRSNFVIVNDEKELVIPQVLKIHQELLNFAI